MRKALIGFAGVALVAASMSACAAPMGPVRLAARSVTYGHVRVDLPVGWKSGRSTPCSYQADTVVVDGPALPTVAYCPIATQPKTPVKSLIITSLYDSRAVLFWPGSAVNWEGQQAWLAVNPAPARNMQASATLTLPWLNTQVSAIAADATSARALLNNVHVRPATWLEIPVAADSVAVNAVNGLPPIQWTDQHLVNSLLNDLRVLRLETPSAVCAKVLKSSPAKFTTLTFSKSGKSTIFMVPRDGCQQVTSGTGIAARTNHQFWLDFDSHFGNLQLGGPTRLNPGTLQRPATIAPLSYTFYFDGDSYMYPAPAGSDPKFTRQEFMSKLPSLTGASAGTPQVFLAMVKGLFHGPTAPTSLMWVARYPKALAPMHGCGPIGTKSQLTRCGAMANQHIDSFVFYDATLGVIKGEFQTDGSQVMPGHLTIDQWALQYDLSQTRFCCNVPAAG